MKSSQMNTMFLRYDVLSNCSSNLITTSAWSEAHKRPAQPSECPNDVHSEDAAGHLCASPQMTEL